MTTNVEPEEAEAIQALVDSADDRRVPAISPRDFARPRRMSDMRLAQVRDAIQECLPSITMEILASLRAECQVEVEDIGELDCRGLLTNLRFPAAVLCFDSAGLPGWAVLDGAAAASAADGVLGATMEQELPARALTSVEQALVGDFMGRILNLVADALEFEVSDFRLAQTLEDTSHAEDLHDSGRLYIHLHLNGGGLDTTLRVYLPAVGTSGDTVPPTNEVRLEPAFTHIDVDLGVYLGCVDIPLKDLLSLEPGDVVPLGVDVGTPLRVYVEDRPCATARWGQNKGHLAIQIEQLGLAGDEHHELGLQQTQKSK